MKKSVYILEKKLQQIVTSVYNPALNPHKSALVKLRNESIKRSQNSQCVLAFLWQYLKLGCLHDAVIDDVRDFQVCNEAMSKMGVSDADKLAIFMLVAAVLHLGNVMFEENQDAKGQPWVFML